MNNNLTINLSKLYKHFNTSPCYEGNDKLHFYTFTPIKLIKRRGYGVEDDLYNEYILCKEERHAQANLGTIHFGLNGTSDWNNCNEMRRHRNIEDVITFKFSNDRD